MLLILRNFIVIIACCLTRHVSVCQDYNSYSFNALYDFGINTVFDVFQDDNANMWFGTNEGLVKFNGVKCTYYSDEKYPVSYTNIKQDEKGRIWFTNFGGQLFYLEGEKVHTVIKESSGATFITEYLIDFPRVVFTLNDGRNINTFDCNTKSKSVLCSYNGIITSAVATKDRLIFLNHNVIKGTDSAYFYVRQYVRSSNTVEKISDFQLDIISSKHQLILKDESIYYCRSNSLLDLYKVDELGITPVLSSLSIEGNTVNQIEFCDDELHILLKKGFYSFRQDGRIKNPPLHQKKSSISGIFRDREDNWWIATLNDGLYIIPDRSLRNIPISEMDIVHSCRDQNGIIYLINRDGNFLSSKPPYMTAELLDDARMSLGNNLVFNPYNDHIYFHNTDFTFNTRTANFELITDEKIKLNFRDAVFFDSTIGVFSSFGATIIAGVANGPNWNKVPKYPLFSPEHKPFKIVERKNSYHVVFDANQIDLYVGYMDNLRHYFQAGEKEVTFKGKAIQATSLIKAKGGGIWVGTNDGFLLKVVAGKVIKEYSIGTRFKGLIEHETFFAFWSNDFILHYDLENGNLSRLDRTDGLLDEKILDVYEAENELIVVSTKSIQKIPLRSHWKNDRAPFLRIESILLFEKSIQRDELFFASDENNITINFSATAIRSQGSYTYRYRLNSGEWIETTKAAPFARFPQLASGDYVFEVQALNEDGVKSRIEVLEFSIDVQLTQKWWFITFVFLLISGFIYWIVKSQFNRVRKAIEIKEEQQQIKKELYKSKIAAIRAQMNPHFMFNALNTIQEFIITNQKAVASEYLADFADLMRKYLEQSKQEEITISEEIETLEIYLGLEDLRVDGTLNYSIQCEPTLNPYEISLPVMLLQPFIENAIKHGLLHRNGDKRLSIHFRLISERRIECRIQDNGIGREASKRIQENRNSEHRSFSTEAIDQKVQLVNESTSRNLHVEVQDLYDETVAIGTLVIIQIDF